jgi:predicted DNA-binding transcriptional regulator AlpA
VPRPDRIYIGAGEVAALMEFHDAAQFLTRRARLEAMGFPRPVPFCTRPMKWRAADVRAWLDGARFDPEAPPATPDTARKVVLLAEARRA